MNKSFEVVNLTDKPLNKFVASDTLYISKMKSGMQHVYFCKFLRLDRGIVVAEIIKPERKYDRARGEIRARANKCYLWGYRQEDEAYGMKGNYCHWFKNTKEAA